MEFNSIIFVFVFLPVVLAVYFLLRKTFAANIFLICASIVFYCYVVFWYFVPLLVSSILDYFIGQRIHSSDNEKYRKRLLIISVVVNLSLMSFFKYTGWLSGELAVLLAMWGISISQLPVPLPPGVSFYTFQTMSYTLDIYRRDFKPTGNFWDYLSFVSFFPQLVAGPIERAKDLLPQISACRSIISPSAAGSALFLILWGVFLKVAVADNFGSIVDFVLRYFRAENPVLPAGLGLIFAYAFAFQIYCDFSAYSTIARGVARLFSIQLSRNFLTPYFASSPSEFWQRWHITLSRWLRDYLYVPLGGNQHGNMRTMRNLVITMGLGGLWHGAGIFFILWGLYHGLLLVLYRLLPLNEILISRFGRIGKIASIVIFFHLVCFGWIFFRATPEQFVPLLNSITAMPAAIIGSFTAIGEYWATLSGVLHFFSLMKATFGQFVSQNWVFVVLSWGVFVFGVPIWITDYLGWRHDCEFVDLYERMPIPVQTVLILAIIYGIAFFGRREANEFIYFQF